MAEILICDTNAVIQLAIIFPNALISPHQDLSLIIHHTVKNEIVKLRKNKIKEARLGSVFDVIQKIKTTTTHALPKQDEEIRLHRMIIQIEDGLDPTCVSSGSSQEDRRFLILAWFHKTSLLTNEKTLFNLGGSLLGLERTWNIVDLIQELTDLGIATRAEIQNGLDRLKQHGETLSTSHKAAAIKLGYKI